LWWVTSRGGEQVNHVLNASIGLAICGFEFTVGPVLRIGPVVEAAVSQATLAEVRVPRPKGQTWQKPKRVIADAGYDSDPLRERLKRRVIELIASYRKNNKRRRYEDGS
jgi:hypothetical protein